jgi:hypothetical protein
MSYSVTIGKKTINFPAASHAATKHAMADTDLGKAIRSAFNTASVLGLWMQKVEKESTKAERIKNDSYLSDAGKAAKMKDFGESLNKEILDESRKLARSCTEVLKVFSETFIAARPLEKNDIAGFLADQEIRAFVRSMPQEEKSVLMGQLRTGEHIDIYNAVMRANPFLSGITEQQADTMKMAGVIRTNQYEVDLLRHFITAIGEDMKAVSKAHDELHRVQGIYVDPRGGHGFRSKAFTELMEMSRALDESSERAGLLHSIPGAGKIEPTE